MLTIANFSVASTSAVSIFPASACSQSFSASTAPLATARPAAAMTCSETHRKPSRNASSAEISVVTPSSPRCAVTA